MDSGAYGSYPARRYKKRFSGWGKKRGSSRRVAPRNQFSYRRVRVGRNIRTDQQTMKCTYKTYVTLNAASQVYAFVTAGHDYLNLATILAGSPEFITRYGQYSYYKLNGMTVKASRMWIDPIALGVNGVSAGFITMNGGLSRAFMNFFPNLVTTSTGASTEYADSSFDFSPYTSGVQSKYIAFPKNFTTGGNSQGLGVWNDLNTYNTIFGQLSMYNSSTGTQASTFGDIQIFDLEIEVYVQFCNNIGL